MKRFWHWRRWPLVKVIVTDEGFPADKINPATSEVWAINAQFRAPFIVAIRPEWEHNESILQHELAHARCYDVGAAVTLLLAIGALLLSHYMKGYNWWESLLAFPCAWLGFVIVRQTRWYRITNEVSAYSIQMKYPNGTGAYPSLDDMSARLASIIYSFAFTLDEARAKIKKHRGA